MGKRSNGRGSSGSKRSLLRGLSAPLGLVLALGCAEPTADPSCTDPKSDFAESAPRVFLALSATSSRFCATAACFFRRLTTSGERCKPPSIPETLSEPREPAVSVAPIWVELYYLRLRTEGVHYLRRVVPVKTPELSPDQAVRALLATLGHVQLYHSTSWHYETSGRLLLTYLACSDQELPEPSSFLAWRQLPGVGPVRALEPAPLQLEEASVLSHGLAHLAFLLRRDASPELIAAVGPAGEPGLLQLTPQLAGELPAPPR